MQHEKEPGGVARDASVEDALTLLEVTSVIWGFDNDGLYLAAYNHSLELVRKDVQQHKMLKDKCAKMESEIFAWRICWAVWWVFIIALGLIGFFAK